MASIPLLMQLLKRLSDEGVEFVVIGGVAAAIHGSPRRTQDVDALSRLGEPNLSKILAAIREIRPRLRMRRTIAFVHLSTPNASADSITSTSTPIWADRFLD